MEGKRKVEVFTAGCPLCRETVEMVKELSCQHCDVTVYNLNEGGIEKARQYGVNSVPAVVVDGKVLECCRRGLPTRKDLEATGLGNPK